MYAVLIRVRNLPVKYEKRIEGVDAIRFIAVVGVVIMHARPFLGISYKGSIYEYLGIFLDQISRFAVPFFFVISGYFFSIKINTNQIEIKAHTIKMIRRLFLLFIFWSFVYLLPYNITSLHHSGIGGPFEVASDNIKKLTADPLRLVFEGTKVHLWFIIGLAFAVMITGIFINRGLNKSLLVFAAVLYIIGLLGQGYADTPYGFHTVFNTRNGPFFSTVFFATGCWLSRYDPKPLWFPIGIAAFILGSILQASEIYWVSQHFGPAPLIGHDYMIGTYFMGVGVALASLSNQHLLRHARLAMIGRYTLGIYAVHLIFIDNLLPVRKYISSPLWEIGYVVTVLLMSIATSMVLAKNRFLKRMVL